MENPPSDPVEAALHEYIDAEIEVIGLKSAADEQKITMALENLRGVQRLGFAHARVAITYEPVQITQTELTAEIQRAGYAVAGVEAAPASPIADAFAPRFPENPGEEMSGKK